MKKKYTVKTNYASIVSRFLALLIDWIILSFVGYFSQGLISYRLSYIAWILYAGLMQGMFGATIGMKVMNIKIVKENGKKALYSDTFVRALASLASVFLFLLGYFWAFWDKKSQTWHDKLAKTIVINAK